jgi:c(7)-type cytochrome triheme protein
MKRSLILLPLLLASLAVGFLMIYRNTTYAEDTVAGELLLTDGARNVYEDVTASGTGAQTSVPRDIYYTESIESVVFSHKTHAVELGYACNTCHTSLFQMQAYAVEAKPDFNMAGLYEGKYCGSCHSSGGNTAFASDTQCARCHRGVKGLERVAVAEQAR